MDFYVLDMTKPRWEIRVYNMNLMIRKHQIEQIKKGEVVLYNEHYYLAKDKMQLLKVSENILNAKIEKLTKELNHYTSMKVKLTRK